MFKHLIDKIRHAKQAAKLKERQRRFTDIVSDKRSDTLTPIFRRLAQNDSTLTDDQILAAYYAFSDQIQTNTFAAAELEWVTIAGLCTRRPHLTGSLIRRGLLLIVWSIGDAITSDDVLAFVRYRIVESDAMPYGGLPSNEGLAWLNEGLPEQKALVQQVLEEVIEQNKKELGEENL
jgi:hypothetical protein